MYESLEAVSAQFNDLQNYLDNASGSDRDDPVCNALQATAQECRDAHAQTDLDRQNLAILHHGFMAANHIVRYLRETGAAARA
ncbi:type III secretion protein [Burkholderia ubonensis]|uniref:type III secretion protein n=1 Tax=Burkholderia ubonensis TaxID=101571 RepID=UPI000A9DB0B6|nr:type III secretion protein [Burkholderia ubonensis]